MTPADLLSLNLRMSTMMWQAGTVMMLRGLAMHGVVPARRGENRRMVDEKTKAAQKSYAAATTAALSGKSSIQVFDAAMAPYSARVSANHKRLTKF